MRPYRFWIALLPILALFHGASAAEPTERGLDAPRPEGFVQPFLITFERYEHHVIVFIEDHPDYEAIEAMVDLHPGRPPQIRATINLHDGQQIDHFNDPEVALDRAAIFTGRETVHSPITFEAFDVNGVPGTWIQFTSYRGEDVSLYFEGSSAPVPELGGFINPGAHAGGSSLPVMWADASAHDSDASVLLIDDTVYTTGDGPPPFYPGGIYTAGFHIGVLRQGELSLQTLDTPRWLGAGERWLYQDERGDQHAYEILAAAGDRLTIHGTTTSRALYEQIIEAEIVDDDIEIRSVRVTGRTSRQLPIPPAPAGLTLDLAPPGAFSISLDTHEDLVTGTASREEDGATTTWMLQPTEPPWAASRRVLATVTRQPGGYTVVDEITAP